MQTGYPNKGLGQPTKSIHKSVILCNTMGTEKEPAVGGRHIIWFSAGAASAVASKLYLQNSDFDIEIVYTDTGSEHPDNSRFIKDCERWFGKPIKTLKSDRFVDTWDVWEKTKFLVSPQGARCTTELKKRVRQSFQQPDDIQVFGYTSEEKHRADRFREQNPEVNLVTPLIERNLNKQDCLAVLAKAGIEIPAMYLLGYRNNNCVGCVKGGMGYWNKIRQDFPDVFERMSGLEQQLGVTVLRENGKQLYLKDLNPNRGNYAAEDSFECSLLCTATYNEIDK